MLPRPVLSDSLVNSLQGMVRAFFQKEFRGQPQKRLSGVEFSTPAKDGEKGIIIKVTLSNGQLIEIPLNGNLPNGGVKRIIREKLREARERSG